MTAFDLERKLNPSRFVLQLEFGKFERKNELLVFYTFLIPTK